MCDGHFVPTCPPLLCSCLHVHWCMRFLACMKCLSAFGRISTHVRSATCLTNRVHVYTLLSIVSHSFFCALRSYHRL